MMIFPRIPYIVRIYYLLTLGGTTILLYVNHLEQKIKENHKIMTLKMNEMEKDHFRFKLLLHEDNKRHIQMKK